jgi:pilus assembly protein CpaF
MFDDPDYAEIFVNHAKQIYVQYKGAPKLSEVTFDSDAQLMTAAQGLLAAAAVDVDNAGPITQVLLADGTRVTVILPPVALKGPCLAIQKFSTEKFGPAELIKFGAVSDPMLRFLNACVRAGLSCLVTGPRRSGKTTMLNCLASFIPAEERLVTCERFNELRLTQEDVVNLQSPDLSQLIHTVGGLRADRILVGECRGPEALDLLEMGGTPFLATVRAYGVADGLAELERMALQAGHNLDPGYVREMIAESLDVIVHVDRLAGGPRKVISIVEIVGRAETGISSQEIFKFVETGKPDGKAAGYHTATGVVPSHLQRLRDAGQELSETIFEPAKG